MVNLVGNRQKLKFGLSLLPDPQTKDKICMDIREVIEYRNTYFQYLYTKFLVSGNFDRVRAVFQLKLLYAIKLSSLQLSFFNSFAKPTQYMYLVEKFSKKSRKKFMKNIF